jgi:hypothetical protein
MSSSTASAEYNCTEDISIDLQAVSRDGRLIFGHVVEFTQPKFPQYFASTRAGRLTKNIRLALLVSFLYDPHLPFSSPFQGRIASALAPTIRAELAHIDRYAAGLLERKRDYSVREVCG